MNEVGVDRTFGADTNAATLLDRDGGEHPVPLGSKAALADAVWDAVVPRLIPRDTPASGADRPHPLG
nr:hypothetical protein [Angustibacter aerolatus]